MNDVLANRWFKVLSLLIVASGIGCASPGQERTGVSLPLPSRAGFLPDAEIVDGLQVHLKRDDVELVHGEDLSLTFDLINTSRDPITLGPTVKILLSCLHSDGTRSFQSPSHIALPSRPDLIRLQPGQSLTGTLTFESIDFSIIGLVEMRALVRVKDTRTYGQPSSWTGRVLSNGFGIHVQDPGAEAQGLAGAF